jgi:outer membrane protein OmpA-like peptidoglycan-associated protein
MAERSPEPLYGGVSKRQKVNLTKTPAGVWVIVGMAVFFVVCGLGISAFVIVNAVAVNKGIPAFNTIAPGKAEPVRKPTEQEGADAGVDKPKPVPAPARTIPSSPLPISDPDEEERTRREVLIRIDLMPSLTNDEKDKLYAQVERAQGFKKIAVIPFAEKSTVAGATQIGGLIKNLREPSLEKLLSDPTVALIVVGYADKRGDETKNLEISKDRAEGVVAALKANMDMGNVVHAVGMGGQDLFDQTDAKKNRVVEVWAAQP